MLTSLRVGLLILQTGILRPRWLISARVFLLLITDVMEPKTTHIGKAIKQKVGERGMPITEFAKAIHCTRHYVYASIFPAQNIDIERLLLISEVLHYDFIAEFYQQRPSKKKYLVLIEVSEQQLQQFLTNPALKFVSKVQE